MASPLALHHVSGRGPNLGVVFLLLIPQRAIFTETLVEALGRLFGAVALSGLSFAGMLYLSPFRQFSRLQFVYFVLFNLVVLLILHLAVRAYVRSWLSTHSHRRLLIVGTDLLGEQLAQEFQRRPWAGMRVVGYTGDYPPPQSTLPVFGSVADTVRVVKEQQIDEVVFALPVEQQVIRVAQEAMANAVQHSGAKTLSVRLRFTPQELILTVSDDGSGFDSSIDWGVAGISGCS
ncbi:MAG: hypothetical protein HC893_10325, partial [Chloroflexaceae bacterium]|nr:hypothetical protein [Chloroflexaceae bacterium]